MTGARRDAPESAASRALPWPDRGYRARTPGDWSLGALNCEGASGTRGVARPSAVFRALDSVFAACGAFEWVTLLYLAVVNTLIVAFRANLPAAPVYIAIHECI